MVSSFSTMLVPRRRPPAPPPPPPRRIPRRLRRDASLISLNSIDFQTRARYRCCCQRLHLSTASSLIALIDMISMTATFARGVHIGRSMQHNPMAISWFVASSLIFVLGFVCTLTMMYGVFREKYLCMIPMLVLKAFSVLVCIASMVTFVYMMIGHNQYLLDLVAEHVTKLDYEAARTALRFGGTSLVVVFALMAIVHVWFFRVLFRCYDYLLDKHFWEKCRNSDEIAPSVLDASVDLRRRTSDRPFVNGHGHVIGPTTSISNSTALTEVDALPMTQTPVSSPLSNRAPMITSDSAEIDPLVADSCYTPISTDINSDRQKLWKAFDQSISIM